MTDQNLRELLDKLHNELERIRSEVQQASARWTASLSAAAVGSREMPGRCRARCVRPRWSEHCWPGIYRLRGAAPERDVPEWSRQKIALLKSGIDVAEVGTTGNKL